jgi:ubiquinone biosynthesis protein
MGVLIVFQGIFSLFSTLAKARMFSRILRQDGKRILARSMMCVEMVFGLFGRKLESTLPEFSGFCCAMGPVYIKFGQMLSTRPDIVGTMIAEDLASLRDKVPSFPLCEAEKVIENELGRSVNEIFSSFEPPCAAASIAQVHKARLSAVMPFEGCSENTMVAVKILRPNIENKIKRDCQILYHFCAIAEIFSKTARRLKLKGVVTYFQSVLEREVDFTNEAASMAVFQRNLQESTFSSMDVRIPRVFEHLSSRRVLTMTWEEGEKLAKDESLDESKAEPSSNKLSYDSVLISEKLIIFFLESALFKGFFHADMHQGNLRVDGNNTLIVLDFGIVGYLDASTRRAYAEILYGFLEEDYEKVAQVHKSAGYVPPGTDMRAFTLALMTVGGAIQRSGSTKFSAGQLLSRLFQVTKQFGMETQTHLLLLQKTMVVVEGVARSLNPSINIWDVSRPLIQRWIKQNAGMGRVRSDLKNLLRTVQDTVSVIDPLVDHFRGVCLEKKRFQGYRERSQGFRNNLIRFIVLAIFCGVIFIAFLLFSAQYVPH